MNWFPYDKHLRHERVKNFTEFTSNISFSKLQKRISTALKVSKYGVFSCPNTAKYGPKETPYLDTFHVA